MNWLQRFVLPPLRVSTVLIGVSVTISTALDNLLLAIVLVGILFNARAVWQIVAQNPVARAAWLLFGVLCVAAFYGTAPWREVADVLGKYIDLAFVPLFMLMLSGETFRHRAQYAFLAAMGLTLLLSYLIGLKLLPVQHWMVASADAGDPVIFRDHITQNNMMAFVAFLALLKLRATVSIRLRLAWGVFAGLALVNVLFMVRGRTGYLILLVLLAWFGWTTLARYLHQRGKTWNWRQGAAIILLLFSLIAAVFFTSSRLQDRVGLVASEFQAWQPNDGKETSIGDRLNFYYNTLNIVKQHPWFGVGTGGFAAAFTKQTQGVLQTHNPHNEYLLITVQTGVIGLLLLSYLFYTQWRCAAWLDNPFDQDAARGLVLAYLISFAFNSSLLDHADGLFFSFMTAIFFANLKTGQRHG